MGSPSSRGWQGPIPGGIDNQLVAIVMVLLLARRSTEVPLRICLKVHFAAWSAEVERLPLNLRPGWRRVRIHLHFAHGIDRYLAQLLPLESLGNVFNLWNGRDRTVPPRSSSIPSVLQIAHPVLYHVGKASANTVDVFA